MKKLFAIIPAMLMLFIAMMLLPAFTGQAVASTQSSVFSNATGCYILMHPIAANCSAVSCASDVLVNCANYQMAQIGGLLIGIAPYIVVIGICIGWVIASFKGMGK